MQCDRAQEFFSDYLERTLDRPMTVAIESHLAGCVNCREEVEFLQSTFLALDSLPEVEPPADGAWQVMMAIRQQRAAEYEAQRRKAPSFLEWLRTLNPMSVAMGASLATMVIGGSLFVTGIPHEKWDMGLPGRAVTPAVSKGSPGVQVAYGPASGQGQALEVTFSPTADLAGGEVALVGDVLSAGQAWTAPVSSGAPVLFNVQVPSNAGTQVLRLTAHGRGGTHPYESTIVVPFGARSAEPMTLVLTDQPMLDALRRIASNLGHPVVVEGALPAAMTLQAADVPAARALEELAAQAQFTVRNEGSVYRLSPAN